MTRRRWIVLVLVSVVVGAAVNVGIAWWVALEPSWRHNTTMYHAPARVIRGTEGWYVAVRSGLGWTGVDASAMEIDWSDPAWDLAHEELRVVEGRVPSWSIATEEPRQEHAVEQSPSGKKWITWFDLATGWPLRTMAYRERESGPYATGLVRIDVSVEYGHEILDRSTRERNVLPLRPLPLGFTLNTLFYALLAFLLLIAPGAVRARRRLRRGRCRECGYDLSGNPAGPCPECGREAV